MLLAVFNEFFILLPLGLGAGWYNPNIKNLNQHVNSRDEVISKYILYA